MAVASGCSVDRGELVESNFVDDQEAPTELAFIDEIDSQAAQDDALEGYERVSVEVDEPALSVLDFTAKDAFSDDDVSGLELHSDGPMIIAFVTPTCPICVEEGPKLAASASLNPAIRYVIAHSGGTTEQYQDYADRTGLDSTNVTHLIDGQTELWSWFGVLAQPSYVLVNADGALLSSVGALQDHGLARAVELLAADGVD